MPGQHPNWHRMGRSTSSPSARGQVIVAAVEPPALVVYCIDVGSISAGNFGWARANASDASVDEHRGGSEIAEVVDAVAGDLRAGRPVALGFECPLFVPVPHDYQRLGNARAGEGNRAWSAGAGTGALATGLVQEAWVLAEVGARVGEVQVTLDWASFTADPQGLFLWEAFVTGAAKKATHVEDATVAVETFLEALPNPQGRNAVHEERVLSLIAAAALWSRITSNATLLSSPCLVLRAAEQAAGIADAVDQ
jgi:hypothetical protein